MAHRGRQNADEVLALAFAQGKTRRDAAAAADVSEKTAGRRWADPAFRRRVSELRGEMLSAAAGRVVDAMAAAVDKLQALLEAESETVQYSAARSLIEIGGKLRQAADLEAEVAALAEKLARLESQTTNQSPHRIVG